MCLVCRVELWSWLRHTVAATDSTAAAPINQLQCPTGWQLSTKRLSVVVTSCPPELACEGASEAVTVAGCRVWLCWCVVMNRNKCGVVLALLDCWLYQSCRGHWAAAQVDKSRRRRRRRRSVCAWGIACVRCVLCRVSGCAISCRLKKWYVCLFHPHMLSF